MKVAAPATVANLGPGFDVFGVALEKPVDLIEGYLSKKPGVKVREVRGVGAERIPLNPELNAAAIAAAEIARVLGSKEGVELSIEKGVKPGGGMGSSGASAAGGAVVANELLGGKLSQRELIEAAVVAEGKIAGEVHFDNVAPAILGGFTIVISTEPLEYLALEPPEVELVIAQPEMELPTKLSRGVLPRVVELRGAVANVGRACAMVAALQRGDLELFGRCMVDSIAEPARTPLIPGVEGVKRAAIEAGAVGSAMAGSGPGVLAVVDPKRKASGKVAEAMRRAFGRAGLKCEVILTKPGLGVRILERG